MNPRLKIELIRMHEGVEVPVHKTAGAAAVDLQAWLPGGPVTIQPGGVQQIGTGVKVHIGNPDYALVLAPRSGAGTRGTVLANTIGLIDSDYQGELLLNIFNRSDKPITIAHKEPCAQGFFLPVQQVEFVEVASFSKTTDRGEGGFGSTDAKKG